MWNASLLLDPQYAIHGTDATLIPRVGPTQSVPVRVIDKTAGIETAPFGSQLDMSSILPGATVRLAELMSLKVDPANLDDGQLLLHGKTWLIKTCRYRPTPDGSGEVTLILSEDD